LKKTSPKTPKIGQQAISKDTKQNLLTILTVEYKQRFFKI